MKRVVSIVALCFIFTACVPALKYSLEEKYDAFDKTTTASMNNNNVQLTRNFINAANVSLDAFEITSEDEELIYLMFSFTAQDWMFISEGESLQFLIGNETVSLTRIDYNSDVFSGGVVYESAAYFTDKELIAKLAQNSVQFRVIGSDAILEGVLTPENQARFAEFYNTYL